MTCMVSLPDGTYMILNGAQEGYAGFGLAQDPNFVALLYDPTQPIGQRMSILNQTIVARMYHSEAVLLQDGHVLVSGSDPQEAAYPEEFRIEVSSFLCIHSRLIKPHQRYVPPYLTNSALQQPQFTLPVSDWTYGQTYQITNVKLFQNSGIRVSLIGGLFIVFCFLI